jgi:hypothetical protein
VRFTGQPAAVRAWIRGAVAPGVTTAAQQLEQIPLSRSIFSLKQGTR